MRYKKRELMRLFEVEVYDGDPDDPSTRIKKETVIAWNATDAIKKCRNVASTPKALHHVTHPEVDDGPVFKIEDTSGPVGGPVEPTVSGKSSKSDEKFEEDQKKAEAKLQEKKKLKKKD